MVSERQRVPILRLKPSLAWLQTRPLHYLLDFLAAWYNKRGTTGTTGETARGIHNRLSSRSSYEGKLWHFQNLLKKPRSGGGADGPQHEEKSVGGGPMERSTSSKTKLANSSVVTKHVALVWPLSFPNTTVRRCHPGEGKPFQLCMEVIREDAYACREDVS